MLHMIRVGGDDGEDGCAAVVGLAVGEERWIVRVVEAQRVVALKCRVTPPDRVHMCDEFLDVSLRIPVADANLVLLRIKILL